MTGRRAAEELWDALCAVREPLVALSVTVWEDRPADDDVMLADKVGDAVVDVCGWLEGAIGAVRDARDAVGVGDSLADCGHHFDRLEKSFWSDLASHERLAEVDALGSERPRWSGWAGGVRRGVGDCGALIHDARTALFQWWREASHERKPVVAVTATNIGQHFAHTASDEMEG
jgi:hypothetical protein